MKLEDLALHGIHSYIHTYVLTYIVNTGNLPNQGRKNTEKRIQNKRMSNSS